MSLKNKKDCPNCQGRTKELPIIVEKIKKMRWNKEYELLTKLDFSCRGCNFVWSIFPCIKKEEDKDKFKGRCDIKEPQEAEVEVDFDYRRKLIYGDYSKGGWTSSGRYKEPGCHGTCEKTRQDMWNQKYNWLKNLKTGKDENFCDDCFPIFASQEQLYYKYPD